MKELGLQAAARVAASSEPLRALTQMAQNFPNLAAALSRVSVPKALRSELKKLHRVLQGGPYFPPALSSTLPYHSNMPVSSYFLAYRKHVGMTCSATLIAIAAKNVFS